MPDGAHPIPGHKMAESLARMYGAERVMIIFDHPAGICTTTSADMSVRDGLFMLGCATHAIMERELKSDKQEASTDPCQSS